MTNAPDMTTTELHDIPQPALEQLERQAIAMLYAIWRVRGINKRIVEVKKDRDTAAWQGADNGQRPE